MICFAYIHAFFINRKSTVDIELHSSKEIAGNSKTNLLNVCLFSLNATAFKMDNGCKQYKMFNFKKICVRFVCVLAKKIT